MNVKKGKNFQCSSTRCQKHLFGQSKISYFLRPITQITPPSLFVTLTRPPFPVLQKWHPLWTFTTKVKWSNITSITFIGYTAAKFTAGGNFVQSLWVKMDYFTVRILLFIIGTAVKIGHNGPILCSFYHNGNCTFL